MGIAGQLRKRGIDFEMVEQSQNVGNAWHHHYDRLHLHTVKQLSNLPHLPFPEDYPLYVSREQLVDYFDQYAQHFKLKPHFGQSVNSVKKVGKEWTTITKDGSKFKSKNVIVATGVNRVPNIPSWSGQEQFQGTIIHAKNYKNAAPFKGKKVLVVGMGNTGAELALDLSEQECETYISVRGPVSIVPRDLNGRPVQLTTIQLAKLPFGIGDWLGNFIRGIYLGDLKKYGLNAPKLSPAQQLKETGKTPVVDIGTVNQIKAGKIKVMPEMDTFDASGVLFKNGERKDLDAIILATGYTAKVSDFLADTNDLLNRDNLPKQAIFEGKNKGLYFIGFDNYKLGGILGIIRTESEMIANHIQKDNDF